MRVWSFGEEEDAPEAKRPGSRIRQEDPEFIVAAENAILFNWLFAEKLKALIPELEPAGNGYNAHGVRFGVGFGLQETDVVGDDAMTATLQAGGEGRFSCAGIAEEGSDDPCRLDGAGMQWEQAILVAENTKDGAEQIGGDVGDGGAVVDFDPNFITIANVVAGGSGDI